MQDLRQARAAGIHGKHRQVRSRQVPPSVQRQLRKRLGDRRHRRDRSGGERPGRPTAASSWRWGSRGRSRANRTSIRSSSTSARQARAPSSTATQHRGRLSNRRSRKAAAFSSRGTASPATDPVTGKYCPDQQMPQIYTAPTAPFNGIWPPFTCVVTQTSAQPDQIDQGLSLRRFGDSSNPNCPADTADFVPGRNYWHDANNDVTSDPDGAGPSRASGLLHLHTLEPKPRGNHLRTDDPRFVLLFITPYNSFTKQGNAAFPIVAMAASTSRATECSTAAGSG